MCGFVLEIFSRSFFKENFFETVLELAHVRIVCVYCCCTSQACLQNIRTHPLSHSHTHTLTHTLSLTLTHAHTHSHTPQDPIVNVRLHLCRLLPSLKSILKLPGDRILLQKLEQTVRKLISHERDPDASQAIRDAVTEMDRIEVAMETVINS